MSSNCLKVIFHYHSTLNLNIYAFSIAGIKSTTVSGAVNRGTFYCTDFFVLLGLCQAMIKNPSKISSRIRIRSSNARLHNLVAFSSDITF